MERTLQGSYVDQMESGHSASDYGFDATRLGLSNHLTNDRTTPALSLKPHLQQADAGSGERWLSQSERRPAFFERAWGSHLNVGPIPVGGIVVC